MKDKFYIEEGTLQFVDGRIEINDRKRPAWFFRLFYPGIVVLNGFVYLWIYFFRNGEAYQLWLGLFMVFALVIGRIIGGKLNYDSKIELNNTDKVILKRDLFGRSMAVFCSREKGKRMVLLNLDRFSQIDLIKTLEEKNIPIENR